MEILICFIAGLLIGWVIRPQKINLYPVDRTGLVENPPKSYIEVWSGKTLNLKYKGLEIIIPPVPVIHGIAIMDSLSSHYMALQNITNSMGPNENRDDEIITIYAAIAELVFQVSKWHYRNPIKRLLYRRRLMKEVFASAEFISSVVNEIFKYWTWVKKKVLTLAVGKCSEEIYGEGFTSSSYSLESAGQTLIVPRFDPGWK